MMREGFAEAGFSRSGTLSWSRGGEPAGIINYTCDMRDAEFAKLELRFTVTDRGTGEESSYTQRIGLSYTVPHLGGKRWWMHCPVNGERVGKLYCPPGAHTFASRKAYRLGYYSQRISQKDATFERLFRLQKKLGCREGWEQPIRRPKGMHHRTYAKLEEEYWYLDNMCAVEMMRVVGMLRGQLGEKI